VKRLLFVLLLAISTAAADDGVRFATLDVYLQSAAPLAAWQFELDERGGSMQVVGVEQGNSAAYPRPPYYDREAVRQGLADRIVVADFSLAGRDRLPTGRVRLATIHLMLDRRVEPQFVLALVAAADPDGRPLEATLSFELRAGSDR